MKIKRIEDMSRLSWLEHVITEASLMTRSIRLHSILMNWMCFPLQDRGGLRPPVQVDDEMHVECWIQQVTTELVQ